MFVPVRPIRIKWSVEWMSESNGHKFELFEWVSLSLSMSVWQWQSQSQSQSVKWVELNLNWISWIKLSDTVSVHSVLVWVNSPIHVKRTPAWQFGRRHWVIVTNGTAALEPTLVTATSGMPPAAFPTASSSCPPLPSFTLPCPLPISGSPHCDDDSWWWITVTDIDKQQNMLNLNLNQWAI